MLLLNTQIKKLHLGLINLSQLEPGLVAGVLAKLEDVALEFIDLTTTQVQAFFTEASHSTHLKTLLIKQIFTVDEEDHFNVDPEVFAQAVTRLEEVSLWGSSLTDDQFQSFFTQVALNTKLKKLDIM